MMNKNIGWHTRLDSDNTKKITGGSFGGSIDMETVNRLVVNRFHVVIKSGGRPVFVDREGREVSLYLSIDPQNTTKGAEVIKQYHVARAKLEAEQEDEEARQKAEIDDLIGTLPHDEIIRRLSGR